MKITRVRKKYGPADYQIHGCAYGETVDVHEHTAAAALRSGAFVKAVDAPKVERAAVRDESDDENTKQRPKRKEGKK